MSRFATMCAFLLSLSLFSCTSPKSDIDRFRGISSEVAQCSARIADGRKGIRDLMQAYNQTVRAGGRIAFRLNDATFNASDRDMLDARIACEADESCRRMLERMREIDDELCVVCNRYAALTRELPPPHRVRDGENHYAICRAWLVKEKGVTRMQADSLLRSTGLSRTLLEGNDVWMAYDKGAFSTFVTQGAARLSPESMARLAGSRRDDSGHPGAESCAAMLDSVKHAGAFVGTVRQAAIK